MLLLLYRKIEEAKSMDERMNIDEKIERIVTGAASPSEKAELDVWLAASPANERYYRRTLRQLRRLKIALHTAAAEEMKTGVARRLAQARKARMRRLFLWKMASAAASLLIVLGGGWLLMERQGEPEERTHPLAVIQPGSPQAYLELETGERLDLLAPKESAYVPELSATLNRDSNVLTYHKDTLSVAIHKLVVPRGGEYSLVLSDGTKVHLNSSSELHYAVNFRGERREVFLWGEAYFEVAKDAEHPFVVHTEDMDIQVLGTSFNVNAYPGNSYAHATLEEGSVEVSRKGQSERLVPGEQCVFDRKAKRLSVAQVDTELFTSWRNGFYRFNQTCLEDILSTLAVWYNLSVEYDDPMTKRLRFTGKLRRFEDVRHLLSKFEETGDVTFVIQGNRIKVKSTRN